jgi:hypothetical protein
MSKEKTHFRGARQEILTCNASNVRRKARTQTTRYDRKEYDTPQSADPSPA